MTAPELDLLPPACPMGYTREQVEQIVGERWDEYVRWSRGQTGGICDGRRWDYDSHQYVPSECGKPHGLVTYPWDVAQFIRGGDPLD